MRKRKRAPFLLLLLGGCLLAVVAIGFFRARSTPFRFLSGARPVSYHVRGPISHGKSTTDVERIFEIDRPFAIVYKEVQNELLAQENWLVVSSGGETWFRNSNEMVVVMPHPSNPKATAVFYMRNANKIDAAIGFFVDHVPERYNQWQ
jgi:hypothetical protein